MSDPWPDGFDEETPESRWGNPERELPRVPEPPAPPDTAENEAPAAVAAAFWGVVLLVNVGLFAVALGPMLIFFRGQWDWGGGLLVFGALALGHAYRRYRRFRREQDAEEVAAEADGDGADRREGDAAVSDDREATLADGDADAGDGGGAGDVD